MPKQYLSVAFAYVGVVIGAGLASGQDLLQYFLSFGAKGLIGIAVLGVLNVVFGVVALQLGSYYRSGHHDEVFERIAPPLVRRIIDVVLVFSGFAMGFVMLSGAGANLEQQFGIPAWAGSAICAVLVVITAPESMTKPIAKPEKTRTTSIMRRTRGGAMRSKTSSWWPDR